MQFIEEDLRYWFSLTKKEREDEILSGRMSFLDVDKIDELNQHFVDDVLNLK